MQGLSRTLVAGMLLATGATANAAIQFTDWTDFDASSATGTVDTVNVTLAGPVGTGTVTNGTSDFFSSALFTPALPLSDRIDIFVNNGTSTYTVSFSQAVADPLIHIFNLASVLTFAGIDPAKLSGDTHLVVAGNTVTGNNSLGQSSGTLRLSGTFSSFSFGMSYPGIDGAYLQVGFEPPIVTTPVPEPASAALLLAGLAGMASIARRRRPN